ALDSTVILRLNPDGSVDSSFGKNGKAILTYPGARIGSGAALLPSGKIVLRGNNYNDSSFLLTAINKNGTLDSSFGNNGFTTTSFKSGNASGKYDEYAEPYD